MTVSEAIDAFLFHCQYEKNLSPKTLKAYGTDLRQFAAFLGERCSAPVGEIDKLVLRAYIQSLYAGLVEKSIKRKVATLKALFHFLEREDAVSLNPFRKMEVRIREPRRLPRSVSLAELRALFEHLYRVKHAHAGGALNLYFVLVRDIAVLEVLFATGARVSEICNLTRGDVDLQRGLIRVFGKGSRERTIELCDPETLATLREYESLTFVDQDSPYFFQNRMGRRLTEQSVRTMLAKYTRQAGIGRRLTPHMVCSDLPARIHRRAGTGARRAAHRRATLRFHPHSGPGGAPGGARHGAAALHWPRRSPAWDNTPVELAGYRLQSATITGSGNNIESAGMAAEAAFRAWLHSKVQAAVARGLTITDLVTG